jgi:hypothetical protein
MTEANPPHAPGPAPLIDHDPMPRHAEPPPRATGGGGNLGITLFLFLVLAGGLYYVWANPKPPEGADSVGAVQQAAQQAAQQASQAQAAAQSATQQLAQLSDRVDKLEKQVAAQAQAPAPAPPPPADLGDLPKRVDDLSARVEALANRAPDVPPAVAQAQIDVNAIQQAVQQAQQAAQAAQQASTQAQQAGQAATDAGQKLAQAVTAEKAQADQLQQTVQSGLASLGDRVAKLEKDATSMQGAAGRAAHLAAVQEAQVALDAGRPLGDIQGAPPALTRFATTPPPTETALREQFPAVAEHAKEVSRPDVSNKGFFLRALTRLQQSVTVRQGDDVLVGDPAAGVLSDAEAHVKNGDLAGAIKILATLHGPAAAAVQNWVDQASALLAARAAVADMAAHP